MGLRGGYRLPVNVLTQNGQAAMRGHLARGMTGSVVVFLLLNTFASGSWFNRKEPTARDFIEGDWQLSNSKQIVTFRDGLVFDKYDTTLYGTYEFVSPNVIMFRKKGTPPAKVYFVEPRTHHIMLWYEVAASEGKRVDNQADERWYRAEPRANYRRTCLFIPIRKEPTLPPISEYPGGDYGGGYESPFDLEEFESDDLYDMDYYEPEPYETRSTPMQSGGPAPQEPEPDTNPEEQDLGMPGVEEMPDRPSPGIPWRPGATDEGLNRR